MPSRITTIALTRDGQPVRAKIEADVRPGFPGLTLIGFRGPAHDPDDLRPARDAVRECIEAMGFTVPQRRIVVHGAPAWAPMPAADYVPAIAAAIVAAMGKADRTDLAAVPDALMGDWVHLTFGEDQGAAAIFYNPHRPEDATRQLLDGARAA